VNKLNNIIELWQNEKLPIKDGLYFADGRSFLLDTMASSYNLKSMVRLSQFDLDAFLRADPECLTSIMVTKKVLLGQQEGYLCCGEGAHGSEGFFARLDQTEKLIWVVYFQESNPFVDIKTSDDHVIFETNIGIGFEILDISSDFWL
jgi:hypothetical protein